MRIISIGRWLICLLAFVGADVRAQVAPVSTLSEDFDTTCVISTHFAKNWVYFNTIPGTEPMGAWTCDAAGGNKGTPGMTCTGVYGSPGSYHLDTSMLVTPLLILPASQYPGKVYIRFDSKTDKINLAAKLEMIYTTDTIWKGTVYSSTTIAPVFSAFDSLGWITHEADITYLKGATPFYLAFRYTSTTSTGTIWHIDNVGITTKSSLEAPVVNNSELPLAVSVSGSGYGISVFYTAPVAGKYRISLYDMTGREVYNTLVELGEGTGTYNIKDLNLASGMYCIKLSGDRAYGVAKAVIR